MMSLRELVEETANRKLAEAIPIRLAFS